MNPLPCPFCGSSSVARWDGPEVRPFYVRCTRANCPGFTDQSYADAEVAMTEWNSRAQLPPKKLDRMAHLAGFMKKDAIRGEMIEMELDRTGVLVSDKIAFSPHSEPLMLKPRE